MSMVCYEFDSDIEVGESVEEISRNRSQLNSSRNYVDNDVRELKMEIYDLEDADLDIAETDDSTLDMDDTGNSNTPLKKTVKRIQQPSNETISPSRSKRKRTIHNMPDKSPKYESTKSQDLPVSYSGLRTDTKPTLYDKSDDMYKNEYDLHVSFALYIDTRYPGAIWTSRADGAPWGGKIGNWLERKGCKRDTLDILIKNPNGGFASAEFELKHPNGKGYLRKGQKNWCRNLRLISTFVFVHHKMSALKNAVDWYFSLPATKILLYDKAPTCPYESEY